jgi:hypothetical protein
MSRILGVWRPRPVGDSPLEISRAHDGTQPNILSASEGTLDPDFRATILLTLRSA